VRWSVDARWNQMRRTFRQEAPNIEEAISRTKTEAGILWGCLPRAVEVFSATLIFEAARVNVIRAEQEHHEQARPVPRPPR
jgi:hypothetical protein